MAVAKISLTDINDFGATPSGAWNELLSTSTTPIVLHDTAGNPTGWSIRWNPDFLPNDAGGDGFNGVGVGEAIWADEATVLARSNFYNSFSSYTYAELIIEGPDVLTIDATGSYGASTNHPDTSIWVNGGTPQTIFTYDATNARANNSDAVTFTDVAKDVNGQFIIRFQNLTGARGYLSALQLTGDTGPIVTVTQTDLSPGGTISGSYSDFPSTPTTLTLSDGTNTITIPSPTITPGSPAGSGTFSGTVPALPTSGSIPGIQFKSNAVVELT